MPAIILLYFFCAQTSNTTTKSENFNPFTVTIWQQELYHQWRFPPKKKTTVIGGNPLTTQSFSPATFFFPRCSFRTLMFFLSFLVEQKVCLAPFLCAQFRDVMTFENWNGRIREPHVKGFRPCRQKRKERVKVVT